MSREDDAFDVSVDPAPKTPVIEALEDEAAKRARDAALASTFDPERARSGKSEEELIAEREAEALALVDAAIAVGVAVAMIEADEDLNEEAADPSDDGGD